MQGLARIVSVAVLVAAVSCSSTEARLSPTPRSAVADNGPSRRLARNFCGPGHKAAEIDSKVFKTRDYQEPPWTDRDGCPVPREILQSHVGVQCYDDRLLFLTWGSPLGAPFQKGPHREYAHELTKQTTYVADPLGELEIPHAQREFRPDIALPKSARDTGYRHGVVELWLVPRSERFAYLRSGDVVERWVYVKEDEFPGCA